jgi:hypothetical protein
MSSQTPRSIAGLGFKGFRELDLEYFERDARILLLDVNGEPLIYNDDLASLDFQTIRELINEQWLVNHDSVTIYKIVRDERGQDGLGTVSYGNEYCGTVFDVLSLIIKAHPEELSYDTPFDKCLKSLQRTINLASNAHAVWGEGSHFVLRNDSRFAFIGYLLKSSLLTCIIELYKALDKRSDVFSFYKLIEYAERQGIKIDLEECKKVISQMEPLWGKVRVLRVKYYAHLDDTKSLTTLFLETGNDVEVFEKLLNLYEKCLSDILRTVGIRFAPLSESNALIKEELTTAIKAIADKAGYPYF